MAHAELGVPALDIAWTWQLGPRSTPDRRERRAFVVFFNVGCEFAPAEAGMLENGVPFLENAD